MEESSSSRERQAPAGEKGHIINPNSDNPKDTSSSSKQSIVPEGTNDLDVLWARGENYEETFEFLTYLMR